jgi:hypothetical protein
MAERKYQPRQQANGKWAVYDLSTGFPTVVNGFFTIDLPQDQADYLSDLLNIQDAKQTGIIGSEQNH